ncbi:hypothetical protein O7621_25105 [Solwaraspora sp. WMMD937]|uniref:hypothetical protein n=1 Tax=Solwaraspora sp. WMMD937 TaxID=3016090 RepID=UPI00249A0B76|nr:hypothetical protein [Solwaraspora sp. WMMD937]WFE21099.1 hypothetical protein O7621_25105 [Solwaraspora sp. WMMD937]
MTTMPVRDRVEATLRAWDGYERRRGATPVIDYDCAPLDPAAPPPTPATSRFAVLAGLTAVADELTAVADEPDCRADEPDCRADDRLRARVDADITYLRAMLGERLPLTDYIRRTQGCGAAGWPDDHLAAVGDRARASLADLGVDWNDGLPGQLARAEGILRRQDVPDAIEQAVAELEPLVRAATGTAAPYQLTIERVDVDAYWSYWLDGAGSAARLRLNRQRAEFTETQARVFALHEVLGHALQSASWYAQWSTVDEGAVRLLSVHTDTQVLLEGLAQALPLFVTGDDAAAVARVRVTHYTQLVRAGLHRAVDDGVPVADCVAWARQRVPFWSDEEIGDALTDRGVDPQLRSYLWAYPAGVDWFVALADRGDPQSRAAVLRAAYQGPLAPADLAALWPTGPTIGGPGADS